MEVVYKLGAVGKRTMMVIASKAGGTHVCAVESEEYELVGGGSGSGGVFGINWSRRRCQDEGGDRQKRPISLSSSPITTKVACARKNM